MVPTGSLREAAQILPHPHPRLAASPAGAERSAILIPEKLPAGALALPWLDTPGNQSQEALHRRWLAHRHRQDRRWPPSPTPENRVDHNQGNLGPVVRKPAPACEGPACLDLKAVSPISNYSPDPDRERLILSRHQWVASQFDGHCRLRAR